MNDEQKRVIRDAVVDGQLPCARAFQLSVEIDIPLKVLGEFCNEEGIKVKNCQLGCFR